MKNRAQGHSHFSSSVGAGSSTAGPIAAGTLAGAVFSIAYGDDINKSGLTTAEFMEKKVQDFDATKIEDSQGVSLGDALNSKFMPNDIGRRK